MRYHLDLEHKKLIFPCLILIIKVKNQHNITLFNTACLKNINPKKNIDTRLCMKKGKNIYSTHFLIKKGFHCIDFFFGRFGQGKGKLSQA